MKAWVWLACCVLVLFGCARSTPAVEPNKAVGSQVEGSPRNLAGCARPQQIICDATGRVSKECEGATRTFSLMPSTACSLSPDDEATLRVNLSRLRESCDELVMRLCRDLGPATTTCEMVKIHTKVFPPSRCELMLGHYGEVLAELRANERIMQPLGLRDQQLIADTTGPSFGPHDAKIVIVEFADFQCRFCATAAKVTHLIREKYANDVRFVFRQFPLTFHPNAHLAAEASLAAQAQGKFWELHDAMFAHSSNLARSEIELYAAAVGLDMTRFDKDLDSHRFAPDVDADIRIGKQVGILGTPTEFLNGTRATNPGDPNEILSKIKAGIGQRTYL